MALYTGELLPRDHAEKVALHRAQVIGVLVSQLLFRGDLKAELQCTGSVET